MQDPMVSTGSNPVSLYDYLLPAFGASLPLLVVGMTISLDQWMPKVEVKKTVKAVDWLKDKVLVTFPREVNVPNEIMARCQRMTGGDREWICEYQELDVLRRLGFEVELGGALREGRYEITETKYIPEEVKKWYPEEPEYEIEEWALLYAPHLKGTPFSWQYQIQGSWSTRWFKSFDEASQMLRKGRDRIYVHPARGDRIVNWKPVEVPPLQLQTIPYEMTIGNIFLRLQQPALYREDPSDWVWKYYQWNKKTNESFDSQMKEKQLMEVIRRLREEVGVV